MRAPDGKQNRVSRPGRRRKLARHPGSAQGDIIGRGQFRQSRGVARVDPYRLFQVASGFLPAALTPFDQAAEKNNIRIIRKSPPGQGEFGQRGLIIPGTPVMQQGSRQMHLTRVGLQTRGCIQSRPAERTALARDRDCSNKISKWLRASRQSAETKAGSWATA